MATKETRNGEAAMTALRVSVLLFAVAVVALRADETNTLPSTIKVDGVVYSNVTWGAVTPATVTIRHKTGIEAIPLGKLPPELQKRFGYDPKRATDYRAAEAQRDALARETEKQLRELKAQQEAERQRQAAEVAAKQAAQNADAVLGPVVTLQFTRATYLKAQLDGTYSANLWFADSEDPVLVTFSEAGLQYMKSAITGRYGGSVFGRAYTAHTQNMYGAQFVETAYWLVGIHSMNRMGQGVIFGW